MGRECSDNAWKCPGNAVLPSLSTWALCHHTSGHTRGPAIYTKPALGRGSAPGSTPNTQASCNPLGCVTCAVHLSSPEEKRGSREVARPCVERSCARTLCTQGPRHLCHAQQSLAPWRRDCQDGWPPIVPFPASPGPPSPPGGLWGISSQSALGTWLWVVAFLAPALSRPHVLPALALKVTPTPVRQRPFSPSRSSCPERLFLAPAAPKPQLRASP